MVQRSSLAFLFFFLLERNEAYIYNPCNIETCNGRGQCRLTNDDRKFECICDQGYTGPQCQYIIAIEASDGGDSDGSSSCTSNTCNGHGTCQPPNDDGGVTCSCNKGYSGTFCETGPCDNHNCGHRSHCVVTSHSPYYSCKCNPGYTGSHCHTNVCASHTCSGHGTCVGTSISPFYTCQCDHGYTGNDCHVTPCSNRTCSGHGTCHVSNVSPYYTCQCDEGYASGDCSGVLAQWTRWEPWNQCSKTCGSGGVRVRRRTCNFGKDQLPSSVCGSSSDTFQLEPCYDGDCIHWSAWGNWTTCSKSCDTGFSSRNRKCMNSSAVVDTSLCGLSNEGYQIKTCINQTCVDGNWSDWGVWSQCDVTCGTGTQTRTRACDSPAPLGGNNCTGERTETQTCNVAQCPIDGSWSAWSVWSQCSVTCGAGHQIRIRACDSPAPFGGGKVCVGNKIETQLCNTAQCPVDGNWSDWSAWTQCDVTCGSGTQTRTRACDSPAPLGGKDCTGDSTETIPCNMTQCAIENWSDWSSWTNCTKQCGSGYTTRRRRCLNITSEVDASYCGSRSGKHEIQKCVLQACDCQILPSPVDGLVRITGLTRGREAFYTCSPGTTLRGNSERTCLDTGVWSGGEPVCLTETWSEWGKWSNCSEICGNGFAARQRKCLNGTQEVDALLCGSKHDVYEIENCYIQACVDGDWSIWSAWTQCDVTCGPGTQTRIRACDSPAPLGGKDCTGDSTESKPCNMTQCASCPELEHPLYGLVATTGLTKGSTADYQCMPGYELTGDEVRTCLETHVWSGQEPACVKDCGPIHDPPHGHAVITSYSVGSTARIECDSGYHLHGSSLRYCLNSGHWSGENPNCFIHCDQLNNIPDGKVFTTGLLIGSNAVYMCEPGFRLNGASTRTCQQNGTWTESLPNCEAIVECQVLHNPTNGYVDMSGMAVNSTAVYTCSGTHVLQGVEVRTCNPDGKWSDVEPTCA